MRRLLHCKPSICARKHRTITIKRLILLAMALAIASCAFAPCAYADIRKDDVVCGQSIMQRGLAASYCPSISANYAYVVDDEGNVYFERSAMTPTQIASVTKIMTAIVCLESEPSLEAEITVSNNAATTEGSNSQLWPGDKLTVEAALKGLMIPSGNDAAVAIAENVGWNILEDAQANGEELLDDAGDLIEPNSTDNAPLKAFVRKMNDKAAEIGCVDTVFENPHGLDFGYFEGNLHSTAKEVSMIAAYAMGFDVFRNIVDQKQATISVLRNGVNYDIELKSTDELIGQYEGACGIKTGYTDLAGGCFAGACERNGNMYYSIVLDTPNGATRFSDTETIFNWIFNNIKPYKLASTDSYMEADINGILQEYPIVGEASLSAWVDKTVPVTFADPEQSVEVFTPNGNISQEFFFNDIPGGISAGDVVGYVKFYQRNKEVAQVDLVACQDVSAPSIFEGVGIFFDKAVRFFTGQSLEADDVILNHPDLIIEKG